MRWSWRLFLREWRQQVLVLLLVVFSVGATIVGVGLAYNATEKTDASFGTANSTITAVGADRPDVAAAQQAFGAIEEIEHQSIPVPGSLNSLDLRAQDPNGRFARPTLGLRSGGFPTGGSEIALTRGAMAMLDVHIGSTLTVRGRSRRVVGEVENPLDLNADFALVSPGQATPPTQVTLLFNASPDRVAAFRPRGNVVEIGTRGSVSKSAAAVIVLVLETIGLLFVGLVAAAGFAVMAQRRLRALGMLGALGATDRQVRLAMVANGAVVGVVGAASGATVGLLTWIGLAPTFERLVNRRIDRFQLPWWAIGAAMLLAVVTAIVAAWWPARSASRGSIVAALSGRPAPPKPAHRFAGAGGAMLAAGVLCLSFAHRSAPNTSLIIGGTIATTLGMLLLGPLFIGLLAEVGRRAPIALRLALRDLARYRARSAAALGAITLALAIAATVAISAAAVALPAGGANLPANQLLVYLSPSNDIVFVNGAAGIPDRTPAQVAAVQAHVDALAGSVRAQSVVPLDAAVDPAAGTVSPSTGPGGLPGPGSGNALPLAPAADSLRVRVPVALAKVTHISHQGHAGIEISDEAPVYLATDALLRSYGVDPRSIDPNADIVSGRRAQAGFVVVSLPGPEGACPAGAQRCAVKAVGPQGQAVRRDPEQFTPTFQTVKLPAYSSAPVTLLTMHGLRHFGLREISAGWLVTTRLPLTNAQVNSAQRAAAAAGVTVETRKSPPTHDALRNGATAVGLLVALGVLAMTVGLIRSETANDLRTLSAAGATSTTRRTLTGATAGALALLGALLGTGGAYVALVAWHRSDLRPLTQVPYLDLATILVGLPVVAIAAGWLLAGREPAAIAHQPLE